MLRQGGGAVPGPLLAPARYVLPSTVRDVYVRLSASFVAFAFTTLAIYLQAGTLSAGGFVAAFAVAFVVFFAESLPRLVEDYFTDYESRQKITNEVEAAESFLAVLGVTGNPQAFAEAHRDFGFPEPLMLSVPEQLIEEAFPNLEAGRERILLVLLLCDRWKAGRLAADVRVRIHQLILGLFEASVRQQEVRRDFARAYLALHGQIGARPPTASRVSIDSLFAAAQDDRQLEAAIVDFTDRFAMEERFQYIRRALNNSEELRNALCSVIGSGALRSYHVSKNAIWSFDRRPGKRRVLPGAFVILKNRWEELNRYIDSLPSLRGTDGAAASNFGPKARSLRSWVSVKVVKPRAQYTSAEEFAESELLPRITTSDGFLAVFGFDTYDSYTSSSGGDRGVTMSGTYRVAITRKTGYAEMDIDVWSEINRSAVPLTELVRHLPFTVFVDRLTPEERSQLTEHYDHLKEEFFIEQLTEWATVAPTLLASAIRALPGAAFTESRATEIANKVVQRSGAFADSLRASTAAA